MRIAITGATGFIGRHVLRALLTHGHDDIIVVGRSIPPADPRIRFVENDLLRDDEHEWMAAYRPTHLLHLAWYAEHGSFWNSPLNRDWCNATISLANAFCQQNGERLVVAGSCAEYEWSRDDFCRESTTPIRPATLYGQEKSRARDRVDEICAAHGVPIGWARIFYPFGSGEPRERLIPSVVDALTKRRQPFRIKINHIRDIMPIEDVSEAFVHLVTQIDQGAYNVCSGRPIRLGSLVETIGTALERDPRALLSHGEPHGEGPRFLVGDNSLLCSTGWQPRYDPISRLESYVKILAFPS